uniref:LITAF domain-containing protein n=1 Tax=Parastrongyloides trichosuri TaxID=131310 RepID=A0A0N4Z4U5_PARTI
MEGNTKIKVDPTFNDIDLKESPIISPSEPPPSYYEFSGHENRIYPLTPVALSYNDPKIDKPIIKSNVDAPRCSNNNCSVNTSKTLYCHHCNVSFYFLSRVVIV